MNEKLNSKRIAFSLGITLGLFYILCLVFFYLMPEATLNLTQGLFHGLDLSKITKTTISIGGAVTGLIEIFFLGLIAGWIFAQAYNWLGKY